MIKTVIVERYLTLQTLMENDLCVNQILYNEIYSNYFDHMLLMFHHQELRLYYIKELQQNSLDVLIVIHKNTIFVGQQRIILNNCSLQDYVNNISNINNLVIVHVEESDKFPLNNGYIWRTIFFESTDFQTFYVRSQNLLNINHIVEPIFDVKAVKERVK